MIEHARATGVDPFAIVTFQRQAERVESEHGNRRFAPGPCPFLEAKRCRVYPVRPWNCRHFICGRASMAEPLEWVNGACINYTRRLEHDPEFVAFAAMNLEAHREWALEMG